MEWKVSIPRAWKSRSEAILLNAGAEVCDWLPHMHETSPRDNYAVGNRALVLNAVIQIAFNAPIDYIAEWIHVNGLDSYRTKRETDFLSGARVFSKQDEADYLWAIEALWSLMWAVGKFDNLDLDAQVPNNLAQCFPSLREFEPAGDFSSGIVVRPYVELYEMRDLYFRAHWYVRHARHTGRKTVYPFIQDVVMERRHALEWVADSTTDWDDVDMST